MKDRKSFARLSTDLIVRWPFLWRLLRGPLRQMFDQLAPGWGLHRTPDYLAAFHTALAGLPRTPTRVLDLGSGTGEPTVALAQRWPSAEVIGVDVSPGMVAEARRRLPADLHGRVRYEVADAAALPFPDELFDLVTLVNMIPFFDELTRVVRGGGYLLVFATQGRGRRFTSRLSAYARSLGGVGSSSLRSSAWAPARPCFRARPIAPKPCTEAAKGGGLNAHKRPSAGIPMTPSLAKEEVSVAPARATSMACLQELFERAVVIECLEHVPGCDARRRACPRVPASPKMYPSRTRGESKSRHHEQHNMPICRAFVQAL